MMAFLRFLADNQALILREIGRHMSLVMLAVLLGLAISLPLGIVLSRHRGAARITLAVAGMVQTIPGLVMLGLARVFLGIGRTPAIFVLTVYAILPILQNTYTGITEVDKSYLEAARGIGMTGWQTLIKVELPLALSTIAGGLRMSMIYTVNWATLAGLIGAGGLGDLIWTGLSTYNRHFIYAGAIPAALLAILAGALMGLIQRAITPRGIRGR